jgi:hypothetical protein
MERTKEILCVVDQWAAWVICAALDFRGMIPRTIDDFACLSLHVCTLNSFHTFQWERSSQHGQNQLMCWSFFASSEREGMDV